MSKVYERTENGVTTRVSIREGLAEINHAMMAGRRDVKAMSQISRNDYVINYKNGSTVRLTQADAPAEETDSQGRRIVAVKGKRYVVGTIVPARPKTEGATSWIPEAFVSYWSERNGETFGATRHASASDKPGSVGRAVWDAANR